jgi:hypothetical protein
MILPFVLLILSSVILGQMKNTNRNQRVAIDFFKKPKWRQLDDEDDLDHQKFKNTNNDKDYTQEQNRFG